MKELKIEVFGRVQGVGFRHFVKESADNFNLKGYVLNKESGSVLIVAQGEEESLKRFLGEVQKGPGLSHVEGVSYFWKGDGNKYESFLIALNDGIIKDQKKSFVNLGKKVLKIKDKVPKHVAIIPDGNRRWAKGKGLKPLDGHYHSGSYENIVNLFEEGKNLGIKYLTFWGFSTENWKRNEKEVNGIFDLVLETAKKLRKDAVKNKIRFKHLGRKDRMPKKLVDELAKLEKETQNFEDFGVCLCLDYGGRDEIVRAVNRILQSGVKEIGEDEISRHLDSVGVPDPDLIIRTSGEKRMSGFMPFQSDYAELYFTDIKFPDFGPTELKKAVDEFGRRKRNYGK